MSIIRHLLDALSLIFLILFVYLTILGAFFIESLPRHEFLIMNIILWILGAWMTAITLLGIAKTTGHLFLKFSTCKKS